jgi:4-amino-4-deoxy-L-arabinose transferase-like glycosyltransferase
LASHLVYEGQVPYLDFAHFQAPLLPYVYGLWQLITGPGIVTGRLITLLFGLGTASFATLLAYRLAGSRAAALAAICFASSAFAVKMFTQTWNIPLSTFLATLGAWWFLTAPRNPHRNTLAAGALALATAVRISFGVAAGWLLICILYVHRDHPWRSLPAIGAAGVVSLLCWGPSLLLAPQQTWFNVFAAQLGRREQLTTEPTHLPTGPTLFATFSLLAVGAGLLLVAAGLVLFAWRRGVFKSNAYTAAVLFLGGMALAVYLPNLLPGDLYPNYLAMALPFMAAVGGITVAWMRRRLHRAGRIMLGLILILLLGYGVASSLLYMPTTVSLDNPDLQQLQAVAAYVAENVPEERLLVTFETPLAIEADRQVEEGMAMGFFSYFPRMNDLECRRYHLLNDNLIHELLISDNAGAVILSDIHVTVLRDRGGHTKGPGPARSEEQLLRLFPELRERYYLADTVAEFGEWHTNLYILLPARH